MEQGEAHGGRPGCGRGRHPPALLAAVPAQGPDVFEVHCVSSAGETVFLDTLRAGQFRWGALAVAKSEDVVAPMAPALVVQYEHGRLVNFQCDRPPIVRPVPYP